MLKIKIFKRVVVNMKIKETKQDYALKSFINHKVINALQFNVCSACQNNCEHCFNKETRLIYKDHQMSLEELEKFIYYTEG